MINELRHEGILFNDEYLFYNDSFENEYFIKLDQITGLSKVKKGGGSYVAIYVCVIHFKGGNIEMFHNDESKVVSWRESIKKEIFK